MRVGSGAVVKPIITGDVSASGVAVHDPTRLYPIGLFSVLSSIKRKFLPPNFGVGRPCLIAVASASVVHYNRLGVGARDRIKYTMIYTPGHVPRAVR